MTCASSLSVPPPPLGRSAINARSDTVHPTQPHATLAPRTRSHLRDSRTAPNGTGLLLAGPYLQVVALSVSSLPLRDTLWSSSCLVGMAGWCGVAQPENFLVPRRGF